MDLNVLALLATIVFILIAFFLIPLLVQIKTTMQRTEELIGLAQREILPLVRELRETAENLKKISQEVEKDVTRIGPLFESLEEAGGLLHRATGFMQHEVSRYVGKTIGTWLGMRSASKVFVKEMKKNPKGR